MSERPVDQPTLSCQWCGAEARAKATSCAACGAALPLLETVGDLVVPGVTHVDPELQSYAKRPLRIPRGSTTESLAPGAVHAAAVLGGPAAMVALGALAAVAAGELRQGGDSRATVSPEKLGEPSEPVLEVARRLQKEEAERAAGMAESSDPAPDASAPDATAQRS